MGFLQWGWAASVEPGWLLEVSGRSDGSLPFEKWGLVRQRLAIADEVDCDARLLQSFSERGAQQQSPPQVTSDRYRNVISTRPTPPPFVPPSTSTAPTSDRWGNIISAPTNTVDWQ